MSFAEKDKERKPSVPPVPPPPPAPIAVAIEQPHPQKADTPKAGPSDDVEPVSETEAPPLDVSDAIPVLPQAAVPEQAALVEEPEPIMLPLPLAEVVEDTTNTSLANLVPLQEPGYAVVSPPEARISMQVSETDWSALESESEGKDAKIAHAAVIQQDDAANQNEKVDLDTLPISNARAAEHKEDEEAIAGARMSALNEQLQEVQNALRFAKEELSSKSDALDDLRVENLKMSVEMEKMRTEKMEISNAAARQKHELQEEILRLKGIIEVERLDNRERIDNLDRENQVNLERIHLLEQRIEAQKEEAGDLYRRNHELELRLQRHEDDVADGRDLVAEKESHIKMVELNNENLASQLLRLQISLNGAKRQNRMLMDQLRQQANELQVSKMGASRLGAALFGSRGLSNAPTEVRTESAITVAKQLNEEIFQTAASLTDRLETISKRFVIEDEGAAAMAEMLKTMLGLELVKTLQKEASNTPEDFSPFIQIALQGCLIASCMHIITSWYPPEWDYASFLYALYERIRGTGEFQTSNYPWILLADSCSRWACYRASLEKSHSTDLCSDFRQEYKAGGIFN